jgi:hypothetical protein
MPVKPTASENESEFISRCMSEEKSSFPDIPQRYAVCKSKWDSSNMSTAKSTAERVAEKMNGIELEFTIVEGEIAYEAFADGEGKAYPWEQCIEDQIKQYGDKATAEKVCGYIKSKYGS